MAIEIRIPGRISVMESAAHTSTFTSPWMVNEAGARGVRVWQKVTAASGTTPTLDTKIQTRDPETGDGLDLPGANFAQQTGSGAVLDLVVYPGVAETANRSVSDVLSREWRIVSTIGGTTPSFTFTLAAEYIR
jgi:hypothetical protein